MLQKKSILGIRGELGKVGVAICNSPFFATLVRTELLGGEDTGLIQRLQVALHVMIYKIIILLIVKFIAQLEMSKFVSCYWIRLDSNQLEIDVFTDRDAILNFSPVNICVK